jgi:hypothetical protein
MGEKPDGNKNENGTGQDRGQQVVSLDPKPLGPGLSANYVIRNHPDDTLTPCTISRKRSAPRIFSSRKVFGRMARLWNL